MVCLTYSRYWIKSFWFLLSNKWAINPDSFYHNHRTIFFANVEKIEIVFLKTKIYFPKFFHFKMVVCLNYKRYWNNYFWFLLSNIMVINPSSFYHNLRTNTFPVVQKALNDFLEKRNKFSPKIFVFKTVMSLKYKRYWTSSFWFVLSNILAIRSASFYYNLRRNFFRNVEKTKIKKKITFRWKFSFSKRWCTQSMATNDLILFGFYYTIY